MRLSDGGRSVLSMNKLAKVSVVTALLAVSTVSPVKAETSFLEAALFFLTGVDTTNEDTVTDREIRLRQYPLVAYLVDGKPCAVRLRNTETNNIWEMDFCKITSFERSTPVPGVVSYSWEGKGVLCISRHRQQKENYIDPDFAKISSECRNNVYGGIDIGFFVGSEFRGRSVDRMIASFKYIQSLLTGKPY